MKPSSRQLKWTSLVVLVVLIGIGLSLLITAISRARETARRMSCSGHLKQLGVAFHNYHATYKRLPAGCGGSGPTPENDDLSNQRRLSALVAVSPYLEATGLWNAISNRYLTGDIPPPPAEHAAHIKGAHYRRVLDAISTADGPLTDEDGNHFFPAMGPAPWRSRAYPPWQIELFTLRCPSDFVERPEGHAALSNYALCYGDGVKDVGEPFERTGELTMTPLQTDTRRGVFLNGIALGFRDIHDGLSTTIMLAEIATYDGTRDKTGAVAGGVQGLHIDPSKCFETLEGDVYRGDVPLQMTPDGRAARGGNWADGAITWSGFNTVLPPNSPNCQSNLDERLEGVFSASSRHPGGCHVLMADGAVLFFSDSIDTGDLTQPSITAGQVAAEPMDSPYGLWGALGTRNGAEDLSSCH